jgi:hypothetical protein
VPIATGNIIVFSSLASNLVTGDTNDVLEIFGWNRPTDLGVGEHGVGLGGPVEAGPRLAVPSPGHSRPPRAGAQSGGVASGTGWTGHRADRRNLLPPPVDEYVAQIDRGVATYEPEVGGGSGLSWRNDELTKVGRPNRRGYRRLP